MRPKAIIDRFTQGRVRRYVLAALTLGCFLMAAFAGQRQTTALDGGVAAVQAQARDIANTVLFTNLSYATMTEPIPAPLYRDIIVALASRVFTDSNVARVRVWTPDGLLQFSTHERDQVGLLKTEDKTLIDQAMQGQSASAKVVTGFSAASTGDDQTQTNLLEVFVPLHVPDRTSITGVAEVDYYYDNLVQASRDPWFRVLVIFLVLGALCAIMTFLSFRRPLTTLDTGVGSEPGSDAVEPRGGGRHLAAAQTDKVAKAVQEEADRAAARAVKAEADAASMREQLKQAQADLASSRAAAVENAQVGPTQLTEFQESLARAHAQIAALAAGRADDASEPPVSEMERGVALASRAHAAERQMREAEDRAAEAGASLALKDTELAAAQAELDRVRAELLSKREGAAAITAEATNKVGPTGSAPAAVDGAAFARLEERIAAAERRVHEAEAMAQVPHIASDGEAPEATDADTAALADDLRARLARTAARKKPHADSSPPPAASGGRSPAEERPPSSDL